jgi:hypothetical protein
MLLISGPLDHAPTWFFTGFCAAMGFLLFVGWIQSLRRRRGEPGAIESVGEHVLVAFFGLMGLAAGLLGAAAIVLHQFGG